MKFVSRGAFKRMAWLLGGLLLLLFGCWWFMIRMPGRSYDGGAATADPALVAELRRDVERLCGFGERNVFQPGNLAAAADWIERELESAGYTPKRQQFEAYGAICVNIEAELEGNDEIVVIGAHYDSVPNCFGANDNGSGVAATLALARRFAARAPDRTLRFVLFPNEELFKSDDMGSLHYARGCRERDENVVAMVSLETLGYFVESPGSQSYPLPPLALAYGNRGNFVAFVGDLGSRDLVRETVRVFRQHAQVPSEGAALPGALAGVSWSDHWSFWQHGYPAIMVTDTAPFRYPHYHRSTDTPDQLVYETFALVVEGLVPVVESLAKSP